MKIEILDTTIREGEQSPNVSFSIDQKIQIVKELDEFGVDFIELGHPVVSPDIREAITELSTLDTKAKKLIHGRARRDDIDDALSFKVPWIGIFFGVSKISLEHKFGIDQSTALDRIVEAVSYAKENDISLRFTAEDASRSEESYLIEVAQAVEEAGADRFSVADTVGVLTPEKTESIISALKSSINIPIHIHCHNDFGLATANSVIALLSGAAVVDVTVNGIGERCGITPLAEIVLLLKSEYNVENKWDLSRLTKLTRKVEQYSGTFNSENKPIVGQYAFTHKAGLHSRAVLKDPRTYEAFDPNLINRDRNITLDKFSGKDALAYRLDSMEIKYSSDQLNQILAVIKSDATKSSFNDIELIEIADEILEVDLKPYIPRNVEAIINMELSSTVYTTRITRWLMSQSQVEDVYEVAGDYDIIAHVQSNSIGELNSLIEELRVKEGILRTHTRPILKEYSKNKLKEDD